MSRRQLTQAARSAHVDTFTRDNLPPRDQWPEFLFTLPELDYPPALNCAAELLDRHVEAGNGARRCILTEADEWSYAELLERSNQVAHVLVDEMGLIPGNRVLLRGPNNAWLVASWFGVIKAGGVAVTTMPLLRQRELETMIHIADVTMAICDHRFVADLDAAAPDEVRGRMPWAPERCTTGGILHGGVLMALADSLGGICAFLNLPPGALTATTSSATVFTRAVRSGEVTAVTRPLHVGRSTIVVQTDLTDDAGRRVAQVTQTQAVLADRS